MLSLEALVSSRSANLNFWFICICKLITFRSISHSVLKLIENWVSWIHFEASSRSKQFNLIFLSSDYWNRIFHSVKLILFVFCWVFIRNIYIQAIETFESDLKQQNILIFKFSCNLCGIISSFYNKTNDQFINGVL